MNTQAAFRIIQSIPSPKAEPFKRWLAQVGYERVQEIENPELAQQRMRKFYKDKGYPDSWIEKRVRGIAIRDELTDEWKDRGISEQRDYAILTAEISKATFGLTPSEYLRLKGLKRENLRDHMTDLELIFTILGEAATTEIARTAMPAALRRTGWRRATAVRSPVMRDASWNRNLEGGLSPGRIIWRSKRRAHPPGCQKRIDVQGLHQPAKFENSAAPDYTLIDNHEPRTTDHA